MEPGNEQPEEKREFGAWKKKMDEATDIPGESFEMEEAWENVRKRLHDDVKERVDDNE